MRTQPYATLDEVPDDRTPVSSTAAAYARLLSLAVHELRTPASVVGGYLRMLQRDTTAPLTERQRKMVDEAEKSYTRMVALVDELSEISKLDAGIAAIHEETFDLFGLVQEVADSVHEVGAGDVKLEVRGDADPAPLRGDRTRLRNAFAAFLRAILREQAAACTIVVDRQRHSSGPGGRAVIVMAREPDVQRAYDAAPAAFDEQRGGLGLALPIATRVIERHGGRVWTPAQPDGADSQAARSTIVISLPISNVAGA
jgi:two-component system, OmpR family, sensor histidine kinase ArlS